MPWTRGSDALERARQEAVTVSIARFADWVKFADAKAAAIVVIMGLGLGDLLSRAFRLQAAYKLQSCWGWIATVGFWLALCAAAVTLYFVARSQFPRLKAVVPSVFFFGDVAKWASAEAYVEALGRLDRRSLYAQEASQAHQLAVIASAKFNLVRKGSASVMSFLAAWAVARLALGLGS